MSKLKKFAKDPLWLILIAFTLFAFYIANNSFGYFLATVLLFFCSHIMYQTYIQEASSLKDRVAKELSRFNDDYMILSSIELSDSGLKGYSDFIVVSPKGIFSIRALDFEGTVTGYENEENWDYVKATSPYDVVKRSIKNPVYYHLRTQQIIERLLERQHIKYIPIQSILVVGTNLTINTDSKIPVVRSDKLYEYISQYADRSIMSTLKMTIEEVLLKAVSSKINYIPMSSK